MLMGFFPIFQKVYPSELSAKRKVYILKIIVVQFIDGDHRHSRKEIAYGNSYHCFSGFLHWLILQTHGFFTLYFLVALSVELCHKWNAFTNNKHVF